MILDDSTSAVDTATDAKIRQGLKNVAKDMTTIIIAQRISSVEGCDKIVVLDDGKINAVGTHKQLLKNCSIYQEVYNSQQKPPPSKEVRLMPRPMAKKGVFASKPKNLKGTLGRLVSYLKPHRGKMVLVLYVYC